LATRMGYFGRALRDTLKHWPSLAVATLCSFLLAALWGANIGACYPLLEITLRGQSISTWLSTEEAAAQQRLAEVERQIKALPAPAEDDAAGLAKRKLKLVPLEQSRAIEQAAIAGCQKWQPVADKYIPDSPFKTVAVIVALLMGSTLVKHFFLIVNEILVARVAVDISRSIRQRIFDRALHMDRASFSKYGTAGFSANITYTAEMLAQGLMGTLGGAVREPMKIASCLIGAGMICWRLLLLSAVVAPVVGLLLYWITTRLKAISSGVLRRNAGFHEVMLESLGNVYTTQAYTMEAFETERFARSTMELRRQSLKFVFYNALVKPVIEFLGLGMLGVTIIGGAYLVLNQQTHLLGIRICDTPLTVSALLVFFGMLIGVSDPLRKLSTVYSSIYAGVIAADAIYPLLDQPSLIRDPEHPFEAPAPHRMLKLKDVRFGYRQDQVILEEVSLDIPFGSTIAIVGHNGSGKSTLINLLCRFYDPWAGSLQLDGIDFRDMRLDDLRGRLALVTQQSELYQESVAYNIRYGSPEATEEEVKQAAIEAHAHEFVMGALEKGYETNVGQNGQRLSGGQRQRVALARALLRDPEILILDEATSQIDVASEQLIRSSLAAHKNKRTMIIITHREALLELADRIYEVRDGQLVLQPKPVSRAA
jgi:subfamily B ATP-binding cassette protein MsbA